MDESTLNAMTDDELAAAVQAARWWTPYAPGRAGRVWVERPLRLDDPHAVGVLISHLPRGWWAAQLVSGDHTVVCDTGEIGRGRTLGAALARALLAYGSDVEGGVHAAQGVHGAGRAEVAGSPSGGESVDVHGRSRTCADASDVLR